MKGKPHENMPDWDNFSKQLFDALRPRKARAAGEKGSDDSSIHTVAIFKRWAEYDNACIKIVEYDAGEFEKVFEWNGIDVQNIVNWIVRKEAETLLSTTYSLLISLPTPTKNI